MKEEYLKCVIIEDINAFCNNGVKIDRNLLAPYTVCLAHDGLNDTVIDIMVKMLNQEYNIDFAFKDKIISSLEEINIGKGGH